MTTSGLLKIPVWLIQEAVSTDVEMQNVKWTSVMYNGLNTLMITTVYKQEFSIYKVTETHNRSRSQPPHHFRTVIQACASLNMTAV